MSTVWDELLTHSPLWLAKLAEASGTTMVDSSGNGRDGTIDASVTLGATGILLGAPGDTCWQLDAAAEGGSITAASWMAPATAFTAIAFCRLTAYDPDGTILLCRSAVALTNSRTNKAWAVQVTGTGAVNGRFYGSASSTTSVVPASAAGAVSLNTLHMVTVIQDTTGVKFYLDGGTEIASAALSGGPATLAQNSQPLTVGKTQGTLATNYSYNGKLQGAAMFGSALSPSDLDAIWLAANSNGITVAGGQAVVTSRGQSGTTLPLEATGSWSWWTKPRAVAFDGKIYVGSASKTLPVGGVNVDSFDPTTGLQTHRDYVGSLAFDDHNNPAVVLKTGQPPIAIWTNHNTDAAQYYAIGTQPIAAGATFGPVQTLSYSANESYSAVHVDAAGTIWLVSRTSTTRWSIRSSTDWGLTWSTERELVALTGVQFYVASALADDGRMRFVASANPAQASGSIQSIWYAELDLTTYDLYKSDGTTFIDHVDTGTGPQMTTWEEIAVPTTNYKTWVYDVTKGADIEVLWSQMDESDGTPNVTEYYYTTNHSGSWVAHKICDAGAPFDSESSDGIYLGGLQFAQPGSVVVSREAAGTWYVEYHHTLDFGATWYSELIASSATQRLTRAWKVEARDATNARWVAVNVITPPFTSYTNHIGHMALYPAPPLPGEPVVVVGGQAIVTSTVQAGVVVGVGGQAVETSTVQTGLVHQVLTGGQAVETDTALAGAIHQLTLGTQAVETDTALAGAVATAGYAGAVLDSEPIAYYRLNETGAPTVMADSSGHGHDGTYEVHGTGHLLFGQPGLVPSDPSIKFVSNSSFASRAVVPADPWMRTLGSFSVECFIKHEGTSPGTQVELVSRRDFSEPGSYAWNLVVGGLPEDGFGYVSFDTGPQAIYSSSGSIDTDTRYHLVVTYDADAAELILYIDAVVAGVLPVSTPIDNDVAARLAIGYHSGDSIVPGTYEGFIDEVALYDRALTPAEIEDHLLAADDTSITVVGGRAIEFSIASPGKIGRGILGNTAVETETIAAGQALGAGTAYPGGQAVETDTARAGTVGALVLVGATSVETDTVLAGVIVVVFAGGQAPEDDTALAGAVVGAGTGGVTTGTVRWVFHDPLTDETWTVPINPNSMTPIVRRRDLTHSGSIYGTLSMQTGRREEQFDFTGVIRSQAHYDQLVVWASKRNAIEVTDHVGRTFRIYITDFEATDRPPIPRAPKRWSYVMKSKLLAGPY